MQPTKLLTGLTILVLIGLFSNCDPTKIPVRTGGTGQPPVVDIASGENARQLLSPGRQAQLLALEKRSAKPVQITIDKTSGSILLMNLDLPVAEGANIQKEARQFLLDYASLFDPRIVPGELKPSEEIYHCSSTGVSFKREVEGMTVLGSNLTISFSNGRITQVENSIAPVGSTITGKVMKASSTNHPLQRYLGAYKKMPVDSLLQQRVLVPGANGLQPAILYFYPGRDNKLNAVVYSPERNQLVSDPWVIDPGGQVTTGTASLPRYQMDRKTGVPSFITYRPVGGLSIPSPGYAVSPAQTVFNYFTQWPSVFHTGSPRCQFEVTELRQYSYVPGTTFARAQQKYVGLPVYGAQLMFEIKDGNKVMSIMGHTLGNINLDPVPKLTPQVAIQKANAKLEADYQATGSRDNEWRRFTPKTELCVFPGELTGREKLSTKLTYKVDARDYYVFIDAHSGEVVYSIPRNQPESPGLNLVVKEAGGAADIAWPTYTTVSVNSVPTGAGALSADATAISTALPAVSATYAAYGWAGLDSRAWDFTGNVNVTISNGGCPNAFFTDLVGESFFCTGMAVNDVIGHEFTHGVIRYSSNLVYQDESGALNESYADIMGNLLFPDAATFPGTATPTWIVGEAITTGSLRDMANPGVPRLGAYRSRNSPGNGCTPSPTSCDFGFVHTNSGITNLAHVLLADGTAIPAANIAIAGVRPGLGRIKVRELAFLTMTTRLTPWSRIVDSELGTHENAEMLQSLGATPVLLPGEANPGPFTQADADIVPLVFNLVGVSPDLVSGYADPQLGFTGVFTFNAGETTDLGCPVTNVRVTVPTPSGNQVSQLVPASAVNYFGIFGVTAVAPGPIGTTTKTNTATWFNIFGGSPRGVYSNPVADPPAGTDNCLTTNVTQIPVQRTLPVSVKTIPGAGIWSDVTGPNPSTMNGGCGLIKTEVELVDASNNVIAGPGTTAHFSESVCAWGVCATIWQDASVASAPTGLPNLSTTINWSAVGYINLRYRVRYYLLQPPGVNCVP